jgi:VWFA-related protein
VLLLRRRLLPLLVLPCFVVWLCAQSSSPESTEVHSTFRSNSRLVVVDVVVTDRNDQPVPGLHKEDFQVLEDGQPQSVRFFEEHTGAASAAMKTPPLPPNTFTNIPRIDAPDALNVLLLDALNTTLQDQSVVHQKMISYLAGIHPGTRLAIFTMSLQLRLVHGFTSDPSALVAALNDKKSKGGPQASPLLRSGAEINSDNQIIGQMQSLLAVDPGIQASIDALQQFQAETTSNQTDARVAVTLYQLQQLARYLGGFPGRKNLIWFSGAFPLNIFQDPSLMNPTDATRNPDMDLDAVRRQYGESVQRTADELTKAQVAIYPVEAGGLVYSLPDASSVTINMQSNARQATSQQVSDLQNDSVQRNGDHATMDELAKDTGGEAFYNNNGLDDALARAMHNGARYYTLDYAPAGVHMDGKYRRIQVKLKHGKYRLAYRRGYNADDGKTVLMAQEKPAADPLQPLMAPGMPNFAQILYLMSVQPLNPQPDPQATRAGDNAKFAGPFVRLGVDFAIKEKDLQLEARADGNRHGNLELTVITYDHYGNPTNWMVRSMEFSLDPELYTAFHRVGLQLHYEIDAPRDSAYLRSGVYDLASGKAGTLEIPLNVATVAPVAPTAASSQGAIPAPAKPN